MNLSPYLSRARVVYCAPDNGKLFQGGMDGNMSQRFEKACVVGALMVAVLLLSSDQLDESAASSVKAHQANELEQLLLILQEEASVLDAPSQ